MTRVFVSHAAADAAFVDEFVDTVLLHGCGLRDPGEIFYSSRTDTGVPSGEDLLSFVRREVGEASLVVAIITPTYQTRPICLAELGAAWGVSGNLFPMLAPDMSHSELEGVLSGMLIRGISDDSALDELRDRIAGVVGRPVAAQKWNRYRKKWLDTVAAHAASIPKSTLVPPSMLYRAEQALSAAEHELTKTQAECADLRDRLAQAIEAKTSAEALEAALPSDETERFSALVGDVTSALKHLGKVTRDAVFYDVVGGQPVRWPSRFDDPYGFEAAEEAIRDGHLVDDDGDLTPNEDFGVVKRAVTAVRALARFIDGDASPEFFEWFQEKHDMPPDLTSTKVREKLF